MLTLSLRRITNSSSYLPFIDGLRFFAILPVLLEHSADFYDKNIHPLYSSDFYNNWGIKFLVGNADNGVLLFFSISGFILAYPFASAILKNDPKPGLKSYFIRRFIRLEPPYLIILSVLFILNVFILKKFAFSDLLPSYIASFFYSHEIIFAEHPYINFVFWSLEIEIQFYLIAPVLMYVFHLPPMLRRFCIMASMLLFGLYSQFNELPFISILDYMQYFLSGILALDLYLSNKGDLKSKVYVIIGLILLVGIWTGIFTKAIYLPFLLTGLIYFASKSYGLRKFISLKWIAITGGMCYTIYMIHYPVMAFFLNRFFPTQLIFQSIPLDFVIRISLTILLVSFVSIIFYATVERPFMHLARKYSVGRKSK